MTFRTRSIVAALCALCVAAPPVLAAGAPEGASVRKLGAPVTVKKATPVARLAKDPARFAGRTLRIEGTVKDVCQGMGCWLRVESGGADFLARSLDEKVLVPKDCKGQRVVVQGVVKTLPRSAAAESTAKAQGHAGPAPEWVLATEGVELR